MSKRILSTKQVLDRVPVSLQTIYEWAGRGEFPKQVRISANRIGWYEQEVDTWIQQLVDARENP